MFQIEISGSGDLAPPLVPFLLYVWMTEICITVGTKFAKTIDDTRSPVVFVIKLMLLPLEGNNQALQGPNKGVPD